MRDKTSTMVSVAVVIGVAIGMMSVLADGLTNSRALTLVGNLASPWALGAFGAGLLSRRPGRGAVVGAVTLLVAVGTYYLVSWNRGYVLGSAELVWVVVGVTVGPLMGLCGAIVTSGADRGFLAATAAPSVLLIAETAYVLAERRFWLWDLGQEPHRYVDVAVLAIFVAVALALPIALVRDRVKLRLLYPIIVLGGLVGMLAFVGLYWLLERLLRAG